MSRPIHAFAHGPSYTAIHLPEAAMFTDKQLTYLASIFMASQDTARMFPSYEIGNGFQTDALIATPDEIYCFENLGDPQYPKRMSLVFNACEAVGDCNYVVSTSWYLPSYRIPMHWGIVNIWPAGANIDRDVWPEPAPLGSQLGLLWKSELRKILADLGGKPLADHAGKAEIIAEIMRRPKRALRRVHEMICRTLLTRDYAAVGREDFTYRQESGETAKIFGWKDPADRGIFKDEDGWKHELSDDPEDRHTPPTGITKTAMTREINRRAEDLIAKWSAKGVYVTTDAKKRLKNSLRRELEGTPTPELLGQGHSVAKEPLPKDTVEHKVKWEDIRAVPGVPWISKEIITDFARFLAAGKLAGFLDASADSDGVKYSPLTGKWSIQYSHPREWTPVSYARIESMFGIPGYNGLRILDSLLNLRQPKLGNEEKTLAIMEKQDLILDVFQKWLWEDPFRCWKVEEEYNKLFSSFSTDVPDGSGLDFPGMSDAVSLYPYQKNAVAKILSEDNTLLAFDTGAGKTYIMIAAAMKLKQMRESTRNMFVVPNNIVGQWKEMFLRMYPDAKLIVVDPAHFKPDQRQEVLRRIKNESFDGVIIAYSCLDLVPLSPKYLRAQIREKQEELDDELMEVAGSLKARGPIPTQIRTLQSNIEKEYGRLMKQTAKLTRGSVTFDQLGITGFFLDEAHNFKNVPIHTAMETIGGLNTTGSVKCLSMIEKVRCVQNSPKGRGAVLATATPLSNSLADAFVMQQYVQPRQLAETGLHTFDNWVKTFARPEYVCEIDVDTSRFRYVKRLARFYNIPELSAMFSSAAAFYAMNDKDGLPDLEGYTNVLINRSKELGEYMLNLCARTERIRDGLVPRTVDNMLKVSTEGRLAALDLRLVGIDQPYDEYSKIRACVESVMKIYNRYEGCTQIIFCDTSTPKANAFNVYDDLRLHLQESGIPRNEIAYIHSYATEARKLELYKKVNEGKIRVLIGSTFKLGIGTNVQTKLKAIHHLDIPWRPADMVQREGRILRKGNTNDTIRICRYISEGSFDAYSWQILERKQRFIAQFLSGTTYERSASDLDDTVLTYAQVKALAISEPLMKDLAEKENSLRRLRMLATNYVQTSKERKEEIEKQREEVGRMQAHLQAAKENVVYVAGLTDEQFQGTFQTWRDVISEDLLFGRVCFVTPKVDILGFTVSVPAIDDQSEKHPYLIVERGGITYKVEMGSKPSGNIRRLFNFLRRLDKEQKKLERQAGDMVDKLHGNETALEEGNPYPAQIEALEKEVSELRNRIMIRQNDPEFVTG